MVQTWSRCTFINILLTIHTFESRLALTGVTIVSVNTGTTVLAWIGLTLILFLFTVFSYPASFTLTMVSMLLFDAFTMNTRLRSTVVSPREAQRPVGARWAQTVESVDFVHTGSPTHTWVRVALINLHITLRTCVSWGAHTNVLIDAIMALSVLTGVAGTIIFIDFTVHPCSARWTVTLVGIHQVDAASSVLAWVAVALLELDITDGPCVARIALTGEGGDAVLTHTMMTWLWHTVIDVLFTKEASEAFCTFTVVSVGPVNTFGPI